MIITEKNTTHEHISKRHMNTQQRENTSKRHENTPKGKHNWKNFVFHFHWFSYMWGFRAKPRSRAHVICTNRRRKKEIGHTWNTTREHISKRHMNTQQSENTSKRHENTPKGKHNWKNFVFHFHWFSYMWGFRAKPRSRAHVICTNRRRKKEIGHTW